MQYVSVYHFFATQCIITVVDPGFDKRRVQAETMAGDQGAKPPEPCDLDL